MPSTPLVVHEKEPQMKQGTVDRGVAASDVVRASTKPRGKFYMGSAAALLLVVLVGFAPTFYLRSAFGGPEFSWRGGVPELS
jgi:hypothetical protein